MTCSLRLPALFAVWNRRALLGAALLAAMLVGRPCAAEETADESGTERVEWYAETRPLYAGIPVTVRFTPENAELAQRAWQCLNDIDRVFNDWRDDSEIGRINAAGPAVQVMSDDLTEAFALGEQVRDLTGGTFDVTTGPLRRLYRAAQRSGQWPTDSERAQAMIGVGPGVYRRSGTQLEVLRPGVRFDFGGLVKGMAVDRAVRLLQDAGCTAGLVQVGGETGCWGVARSGHPHRIGVPSPDAPDDPGRFWVRLQDRGRGLCGSTSGNYRQPVLIAGKPYYHVYDPRSGLPADTQVLSFSVIFPGTGRNGEADGLCKAGIITGDAALELVRRRGGEAMLLRRRADGGIAMVTTPGWSAFTVPDAAPRKP
jgi:thiamine biosynthesis lipoprotein